MRKTKFDSQIRARQLVIDGLNAQLAEQQKIYNFSCRKAILELLDLSHGESFMAGFSGTLLEWKVVDFDKQTDSPWIEVTRPDSIYYPQVHRKISLDDAREGAYCITKLLEHENAVR